MRIDYLNTYSPKFGISEWKKERIRQKAAEAQEEYIRKNSYSSNPKSCKSTTSRDSKPKHPEFWSPDYWESMEACRKYANSLKRPDPSSMDYYDQLEDWNEYSRYRTKR